MNLPTNKLRDLIAALQTLDPDIETDIESVQIAINSAQRRALQFNHEPVRLTEEEFLDKLCALIDDSDITDDFIDIPTTAREIIHLYKRAQQAEEIDELRDTLQDVASDLKHAVDRLIDL